MSEARMMQARVLTTDQFSFQMDVVMKKGKTVHHHFMQRRPHHALQSFHRPIR